MSASLAGLHDLGGGRVVCHPTPGATGPVLARDLLEALGKRRDAITRDRRARDGAALVRVWMRAERVEHLVVLRAHRLHSQLLGVFDELADETGATVWLVWHHTDPPASGRAGETWSWPRAVDAIRSHPPPGRSVRLHPVEVIYRAAVAEARREARLWRVAPPRQRRYTRYSDSGPETPFAAALVHAGAPGLMGPGLPHDFDCGATAERQWGGVMRMTALLPGLPTTPCSPFSAPWAESRPRTPPRPVAVRVAYRGTSCILQYTPTVDVDDHKGHLDPSLSKGRTMPLPTFAMPTTPESHPETLSRTVAAARLELHVAHIDKMVRAGMLPLPITAASVEQLHGRSKLRVLDGQLTVLRTDARKEADHVTYPLDPRPWIGFHVEHTDTELEETSLRWWRCDPARVLGNELFTVTIATFPVAVYRILGHEESCTRPGEEAPRQHFTGQLLARITPGMVDRRRPPMPGHLRPLVDCIMASRIAVSSGGPIGYLEPVAGQ